MADLGLGNIQTLISELKDLISGIKSLNTTMIDDLKKSMSDLSSNPTTNLINKIESLKQSISENNTELKLQLATLKELDKQETILATAQAKLNTSESETVQKTREVNLEYKIKQAILKENEKQTIAAEVLAQKLINADSDEARALILSKEALKEKNKAILENIAESKRDEQSISSLTAQLNNLLKQYRDAAPALRSGFIPQIQALDKEIAKSQQELNLHSKSLNVNVKSFNAMEIAMARFIQESPNFAQSIQIGLMSISNNISAIQESFKIAKIENENLVASGEKAIPMWKRISSAILSWNTAIMIAVTAIMFFKDNIANWIKSLQDSNNEIGKQINTLRDYDTVLKEINDTYSVLIGYGVKEKDANKLKIEYLNSQIDSYNKILEPLKSYQQYLHEVSTENANYEKSIKGVSQEEFLDKLKKHSKSLQEIKNNYEYVTYTAKDYDDILRIINDQTTEGKDKEKERIDNLSEGNKKILQAYKDEQKANEELTKLKIQQNNLQKQSDIDYTNSQESLIKSQLILSNASSEEILKNHEYWENQRILIYRKYGGKEEEELKNTQNQLKIERNKFIVSQLKEEEQLYISRAEIAKDGTKSEQDTILDLQDYYSKKIIEANKKTGDQSNAQAEIENNKRIKIWQDRQIELLGIDKEFQLSQMKMSGSSSDDLIKKENELNLSIISLKRTYGNISNQEQTILNDTEQQRTAQQQVDLLEQQKKANQTSAEYGRLSKEEQFNQDKVYFDKELQLIQENHLKSDDEIKSMNNEQLKLKAQAQVSDMQTQMELEKQQITNNVKNEEDRGKQLIETTKKWTKEILKIQLEAGLINQNDYDLALARLETSTDKTAQKIKRTYQDIANIFSEFAKGTNDIADIFKSKWDNLYSKASSNVSTQETEVTRQNARAVAGLANTYDQAKEKLAQYQAEKEKAAKKQNQLAIISARASETETIANYIKMASEIWVNSFNNKDPLVATIEAVSTSAIALGQIIAYESKIKSLGGYYEKGGLIEGNPHSKGGVPAWVTSTQKTVILEGEEFITNKKSTAKSIRALTEINNGTLTDKEIFGKQRLIHTLKMHGIDENTIATKDLTKAIKKGKNVITFGDRICIVNGNVTKFIRR